MLGTKGLIQTTDPEQHRKDAPAATGGGTQLPMQEGSTAAEYWKNVAAAGRQARVDAKPQAQGEKPARQRGLHL